MGDLGGAVVAVLSDVGPWRDADRGGAQSVRTCNCMAALMLMWKAALRTINHMRFNNPRGSRR